jgi:hypothetical protein
MENSPNKLKNNQNEPTIHTKKKSFEGGVSPVF